MPIVISSGSPSRKMATQLELNFELKCSTDGSVTQKIVSLSPVPATIAELKQRIENGLSIPKSCLSMSLPDGQGLLDSQQVVNLYLRDGDTLNVTYFAQADVRPLRALIERSIRPALELLRANSALEDANEMQKNPDSEAVFTSCQGALFEIAFKGVYPWGSPRSEANRRYLLQEGLLDVILEIYTILLPLPWNERGFPLQNLEICCLMFLWNFSETRYIRQLIVNKGGFSMMLQSLMHQTREEVLTNYSMHDIFDVVTGCLSNYSELQCCQIAMAKNSPVLQQILHFAIHGPSVNASTKKSIGNLLFGLTQSQEAHHYLVQRDVLEPLANFSKIEDVSIRYVLGSAYAQLVLFSLKEMQEEFLTPIISAMRVFLLKVKPTIVRHIEERYQDNWISMLPFLQVLYACGVETVKYSDARLHKLQSSKTFAEKKETEAPPLESYAASVSLTYVLFSLMIELSRTNMVQLLIKEGLLEYITILPWGLDNGWHTQCLWVQEEVKKTKKLPVPSLSSIAKGKLARTNKEYSGLIAA